QRRRRLCQVATDNVRAEAVVALLVHGAHKGGRKELLPSARQLRTRSRHRGRNPRPGPVLLPEPVWLRLLLAVIWAPAAGRSSPSGSPWVGSAPAALRPSGRESPLGSERPQ